MDLLPCLLIDCGKKTKHDLTKELEQYNLTCRQATVIKIIDQSSMTAKDIGEEASIDKATLSAMLKKLEKNNMIEYEVGEKDRREKIYSLTKEGKELLPKILDVHMRYKEKVFGQLSDEEYEKLTKYLKKIKENL